MKDILKSLQQDFIAYQGSLTTPPCSEAVSWLVARHPMKISKHDVRNWHFPIGFSNDILCSPPDDSIQENIRFRRNANGAELQTNPEQEQAVLLELLSGEWWLRGFVRFTKDQYTLIRIQPKFNWLAILKCIYFIQMSYKCYVKPKYTCKRQSIL